MSNTNIYTSAIHILVYIQFMKENIFTTTKSETINSNDEIFVHY